MILKLRDDYQKKKGASHSLTDFHDRFLGVGLVSVKIIGRELVGSDSPML